MLGVAHLAHLASLGMLGVLMLGIGVASLDVGTSSIRFIIFTSSGLIAASSSTEVPTSTPHPGWVEQDATHVLSAISSVISSGLAALADAGYAPSSISGIGITNHRESVVAWEASTGKPLAPLIVWSDTRTQDLVEKYVSQLGSPDALAPVTGLPLSTYFSALKMRWLLDNVPEVAAAAANNDLRLSTVDAFVIAHLAGLASGVYVSDVTNASRTLLMDLATTQWSPRALSVFGIQESWLPTIVSSAEVYAVVDGSGSELDGVPIAGCLGDQQAALVGQRCFAPGQAKNTYGTGCFMLLNVGPRPRFSSSGLLGTVAYKLGPDAPVHYALEGSVAVAGLGVRWARDNLEFMAEAHHINDLASTVPDTAGVVFVPAFSGLFAPHWTPHARGLLTGLTLKATKHHIARAILEAPAWRTAEVLSAMTADAPDIALSSLRVDGGMAASDLLCRLQADILNIDVERPDMLESTALGAAAAAGIATGLWDSPEAFADAVASGSGLTTISPSPDRDADAMASRRADWDHAVQTSKLPADFDPDAQASLSAALQEQESVTEAIQALLVQESAANNELNLNTIPQLRSDIEAALQRANMLEAQVRSADAQTRSLSDANASLNSDLDASRSHAADLESRVAAQAAVLTRAAAQYKTAVASRDELAEQLQESRAQVDTLTAELLEAAKAVKSSKDSLAALQSQSQVSVHQATLLAGGVGLVSLALSVLAGYLFVTRKPRRP